MNILFVSYNLSGANLALHLLKEGHEVRLFIEQKKQHAHHRGEIMRIEDWKEELPWVSHDGLVIIDSCGYAKKRNSEWQVRYLIVGSDELSDKINNDSEYERKIFSDNGASLSSAHHFSSIQAVVTFVNTKIRKHNKHVAEVVGNVKAFLDADSVLTTVTAKRASILAVGRILFEFSDWVIAAGLGSLIFWMEAKETFSSLSVWLVTFAYDFIASAIFYFLSDMTRCDFTFGQSFRRVADRLYKKGFGGKILAIMLLLGVSARAIVWEGPEVICFLFHKELKTRRNIWLALFGLSALQGLFGAWLYTNGYELWAKYGSPALNSHYLLLGILTFVGVVMIATILKQLVRLGARIIGFYTQETA